MTHDKDHESRNVEEVAGEDRVDEEPGPRALRRSDGGPLDHSSEPQDDGKAVEAELHDDDEDSALEVIEHYRGPLPDPVMLRRYDELVPGSAEKMMDAYLRRQKTADEGMGAVNRADAFSVTVGTIAAPALTLGALGCATWLLFAGIEAGAVLVGIPAILGGGAQLVAAFRRPKD